MAVKKSLVWIAVGAALATAGVAAFWLWRRYRAEGAAEDSGPEGPEPEPEEAGSETEAGHGAAAEPQAWAEGTRAESGGWAPAVRSEPDVDVTGWAKSFLHKHDAAQKKARAERAQAEQARGDQGQAEQAEAEQERATGTAAEGAESRSQGQAEQSHDVAANEGPTLVEDAPAEPEQEQGRARFLSPEALNEEGRGHVRKLLRKRWDGRRRGRELEAEVGDDVALVTAIRLEHAVSLELLMARVLQVRDEVLEVEVLGSAHGRDWPTEPTHDHGIQIGDRVRLQRSTVIEVAKARPPNTLVPKKRKRRYKVSPGERIVLKAKGVAETASVRPSRDDVKVAVVERNPARVIVTLEGPAGDVNLALVVADEDGERERPVTSWKFELVEGEAA